MDKKQMKAALDEAYDTIEVLANEVERLQTILDSRPAIIERDPGTIN